MFTGELFPKLISEDTEGGPAVVVDIVMSDSGIEWRNLVSELPRWEYDVSHAAQNPTRYKQIQHFFVVHDGPANSFLYWDPLDYTVESGQGVFAQIDATHFQMQKQYQYGATTKVRTITKPVSGTVSVSGGSVSSIDYDTGIVHMTSGTPTSWTGQFMVHARFDTKSLRSVIAGRQPNGDWIVQHHPIPIVEVKTAD